MENNDKMTREEYENKLLKAVDLSNSLSLVLRELGQEYDEKQTQALSLFLALNRTYVTDVLKVKL